MMKYLQKLGRSLTPTVAVLPVASILMGIGYWIDPAGWGGGSPLAAFLIAAGGEIIDNMSILFAVGAGIYGFLDRLLIPLDLHHPLNSVF